MCGCLHQDLWLSVWSELLFQPAIAIPIVQLTLVLRKPSSCQPTLQQTFKDDGSYSFMGLSIVACQVLLGATWPTTGRWASKASFAHCQPAQNIGIMLNSGEATLWAPLFS